MCAEREPAPSTRYLWAPRQTPPLSTQSSDLHEALFLALVGNKPRFVRLLLENGASLREFLREDETLCELYRQLPACLFRGKLPKSDEGISLSHVAVEVKKLLGRFTQLLYWNAARDDICGMPVEHASSSVSPFTRPSEMDPISSSVIRVSAC